MRRLSREKEDAGDRGARRRRPEASPAQRALGLLTRREHSRRELEHKLVARGVERPAAQAAVEKLAEAGWQDDARFAGSLARTRAAAGYGPLYIQAELAGHGLTRDAIAHAFGELDADWIANARRLLARRAGPRQSDPGPSRKVAAMLLRRGFSGDQVRAALRFEADESVDS